MQLSAFAWLFFLYCKILVIPANRIGRESTKRGKTYVWYLQGPQMTVISKVETMSNCSSASFCSWLKQRWLELACATLGTASAQRPLGTGSEGLLPSEEHQSQCWSRMGMWMEAPFWFLSEANRALCLQRKETLRPKKKSMNRAERTNSLGTRFLQKRSMGTVCQAVHWNTGLNSAHLDIPLLKYLHMCLGVSNVSLNWGL